MTAGNGVVVYQSDLLAHVPHGFSTRIGGVSAGPFAAMNLGNPNGCPQQDDLANIAENYRRLQGAIGCEGRSRAQVHQVHGCDVRQARASEAFDIHAKADAIISDDPQQLLSVRTADCVPVLLASIDGRFVAAVHAGWRGVVAGAVTTAARAMMQTYALDSPASLVAAIGPSIGFDAFEVGSEVLAEFHRVFGDHAQMREVPGGKGFVDLRRAISIELQRLGVPANQIDTTDRCTFTHANEFFSHRRENGVTGRMASVIGALG